MIEGLIVFGVILHLIYNAVDLAEQLDTFGDWKIPFIRVLSELVLICYLLGT